MSRPKADAREGFQVVQGENEVAAAIHRVFGKAKGRIDICCDRNGLGLAMRMSQDPQLREFPTGPRVRVITELIRENQLFGKMLSGLVELRHLDGISGGFVVTDSEFLNIPAFQDANPITDLIYSNAKSLVARYQQLFSRFWEKGVAAEARMKTLEESIQPPMTSLIDGERDVVVEFAAMIKPTDKLLMCTTVEGMKAVLQSLQGKALVSPEALKERLRGARWLTSVGANDGTFVEGLIELGIEIRHVDNLPALSFICNYSHVLSTLENPGDRTIFKDVLSSNDPAYALHFHNLFEELWRQGVGANSRIEAAAGEGEGTTRPES